MEQISFQEYTDLPLREIVRVGSSGVAMEVTTPMGLKIIEYRQISNSFFAGKRSFDTEASDIIKQLRELEFKARDYLLEQWKKSLTN